MIKNIFTVSLLFLSPIYSFSQQKEFDNSKWTSLRAELLKKTNTIMAFQVALLKSKGIDKKVWAQLAVNAINLNNHLDSVRIINNATIKTTTKLNSNLTTTLGKTIMQLLANDQKTLTESAEITAKLEGIEKQLIIEKQAYNKACEESNRADLLFDEKTTGLKPTGIGY